MLKNTVLLGLSAALLSGCSLLTPAAPDYSNNVIELPIRQVKEGQRLAFDSARDAFIKDWKTADGVTADREFRSVYSIPASPKEVYVGMTSFTSTDAFQKASAKYGQTPTAYAFYNTFDALAFLDLQQTEGPRFDLKNVVQPGQVLEIAVRKVNPAKQDAFNAARLNYIKALGAAPGVLSSYEFKVLGDNKDNLTVGMTLYASAEAQSAVNSTVNASATASSYFSTFDIVTIQYVRSYGGSTLPTSIAVGNGAPEDINAYGSTAYVSNFFDGSILKLDLAKGGAASTFVPATTDAYHSGWGLRVVPGKNWLLAIQNQPYDFNPAHAQAGRVTAYDLSNGAKVKSWDLPVQTVGNSVDVDAAGNIYVGDIGPNTRIVKIDPATNAVTTWATSSQWVNGGFGFGGMVYNGKGLYAAHNGTLWYIGINADGSPATPQAVKIEGDPKIFADGMTWTDGGLIYAENDAQVAGAHGTVYRVQFSDPTTAKRAAIQTDLRDPSGVSVGNVNGQPYLLVNESQLGYVFGVDQGQPNTPYQVKVIPR